MRQILFWFFLLFCVAAHAQQWPSNTIKWGNGAASDKSAVMNVGGSNPTIKWNNASSQLTFSNDGSTFKAVRAVDSSGLVDNFGLSVSIASNTLVAALKQADGSTNGSATNPVRVGFRGATSTSGDYTVQSFTGALSVTLSATDSLGATPGKPVVLYAYLISDTSSEICLSYSLFDEGSVQSASALSGGADLSASVLYCTSAHTNKPIRVLGRLIATWSNPNWGTIAEASVTPFVDSQVVSTQYPLVTRMSAARIDNNGSACTATQFGTSGWISSLTRNGTGDCTLNLASIFTTSPFCTVSGVENTLGRDCHLAANTSTSAIQVICGTYDGPTARDMTFYIVCMDPR